MLFAISYYVLPELREHLDQIMWAYEIRATFAALGLVATYCVLRRSSLRSPIRTIASNVMCVFIGVIPACLFWSAVEFVGGGYWFWEACEAGAEREILLGAIGLACWSFLLGQFVLTFLRLTVSGKAAVPIAATNGSGK